MADNTTLPLGTEDGDTYASDDIAGVKHQRVKVQHGADGAATDTSDAAPMPVTPIIGQLGVQGGSGASNALTQRVTLATDITLPPAGTAATSIGKAIGNAAGATDTGIAVLNVRDDALSALSDAEGDYIPDRVDSTGAKWVRVSNGLEGIVDDAAITPGTTPGLPCVAFADESSTDSVNEGDGAIVRCTLDRKLIVNDQPHSAGGADNYTALSTAAVLTAAIKASPGNVYSLEVFNVNAAARYVRLYNMTTAPASTDTANVVWQGVIPGATTGGGFTISWPKGKFFSTGIGIRASTGIAHNDTGALAANELTFNVSYK